MNTNAAAALYNSPQENNIVRREQQEWGKEWILREHYENRMRKIKDVAS